MTLIYILIQEDVFHLVCQSELADFYGLLMHPNYQIQNDWHDLGLKIDLSLKEISVKINEPYEWSYSCHCEKCLSAKNLKGKGKGKKSEKL